MRRISVAAGIEVVDYEAGIGGEGYDPPKPKRQTPTSSVAQPERNSIIEPDVEQRHREWVQAEGWQTAGRIVTAVASDEGFSESFE